MKIEVSPKKTVSVASINCVEVFSCNGVWWCVVDYSGVFDYPQSLEKMVVCLNLSTGVLGAFGPDAKVEPVPDAKLS